MQRLVNSPSGRLVPTIEGQSAFVPGSLPDELQLNPQLVMLLDQASRSVAMLAGVGETIPNPHLLIRPFLRREATLSSKIEGTEASLTDVLEFEARGRYRGSGHDDTDEVLNYVIALERGIDRLDSLPISYRLVRELHEILMSGVRGQDKRPGEFRTGQVWIGPPGSSIRNARFVPPPPALLRDLFLDWEGFVNDSLNLPPLVRCAMMHYQFEAIHPFTDGNGRIGRLLITLFLKATGVLTTPLLYLSAYFERDRQRYYDELLNVSATGDWERWLSYFLEGAHRESQDALVRIRRLRDLQDEWRELLLEQGGAVSGLRLLEELFARPVLAVSDASSVLEMTDPGARGVLNRLVEAGILTRIDTWPVLYIARRLIEEIDKPIEDL